MKKFETRLASRELQQNVEQIVDAVALREAAGIPFTIVERKELARLRRLLPEPDAITTTP